MNAKVALVAFVAAAMFMMPASMAIESHAAPDQFTATIRIRECGGGDPDANDANGDPLGCSNGYDIVHAGGADIVYGVNDTDQLQVRVQMFRYYGADNPRDGNNPSEYGYYPTDEFTNSCALYASVRSEIQEPTDYVESYNRVFPCSEAVHPEPGDDGWSQYNVATGTYIWDIPIGEMIVSSSPAGGLGDDDTFPNGNYLDLFMCTNGKQCIHYSSARNAAYDQGGVGPYQGGGNRIGDATDGDYFANAGSERDLAMDTVENNQTLRDAGFRAEDDVPVWGPLREADVIAWNPMITPILLVGQPFPPCVVNPFNHPDCNGNGFTP